MSDTIISVENLGKCYRIRHQQQDGMRYKALRDVLADKSRGVARRLWSALYPAKGKSEIRNQKSTEDFWALKDVSFEVKQGEVMGIIGRNGAGKSTLLKILSRITEPTEGRVRIRGRVASLLEVGTGFHPELTGRENIFLNGAILGMSRAEIKGKFDEIVAFAEIEKFLDTPVKRYSSGMYVRLAFAVAAHLEPEILIVDEVLAVGDAEFQKKCLGKIESVSRSEGRTVLFVSHNMPAIQQLCGRCVLLSRGSIALDGSCSEVSTKYLLDATHGNGRIDLRNHPARPKSSRTFISELVMRNGLGEPTSTIFPQQNMVFEITVESVELIKEPRLALAIEDSDGRRLMTLASYFENTSLPDIQGTNTFKCECGPLLFGPGRYLLSVSIGTKSGGLLDSLDSASWFQIEWDNNFPNREPYHAVYGPLLRNSSWSLI